MSPERREILLRAHAVTDVVFKTLGSGHRAMEFREYDGRWPDAVAWLVWRIRVAGRPYTMEYQLATWDLHRLADPEGLHHFAVMLAERWRADVRRMGGGPTT